jgi:outer membrane lipopolysaccharide assembly protein LptE/RlpB
MQKRYLLLILLLITLFISACSSQIKEPEKVTCEKPYILSQNGCCLDSNNNYVCDAEEPKNPSISSETVTSSNDVTQVTCPKELNFPLNYNPKSEVEVKFTAIYTGFGSNSYATGFECDDGYVATTNPIRVTLENNQTQIVKTKITTSPKECTFKLVEIQDINKVVSCKIVVKPFL